MSRVVPDTGVRGTEEPQKPSKGKIRTEERREVQPRRVAMVGAHQHACPDPTVDELVEYVLSRPEAREICAKLRAILNPPAKDRLPLRRVRCELCSRWISVNLDGTLHRHKTRRDPGAPIERPECENSGVLVDFPSAGPTPRADPVTFVTRPIFRAEKTP